MKIKLSTHTFLVQAVKVNCNWVHFELELDYIRNIKGLARDIRNIVEMLPNIDEVDFKVFAEYFVIGYKAPAFEIYLAYFTFGATPPVINKLLKNMLEVVPDGEIILELSSAEFSSFRRLVDDHLVSREYLNEFRDPKYKTFTVVEE